MTAVVWIEEPFELYGDDLWAQPFEIGEYPAFTDAVASGYTGTLVEWLEANPAAEWVPEDLTGVTGWAAKWRPSAGDETKVLDLEVVIVNAVLGKILVRAISSIVRQMGPEGATQGSGVFDIEASGPVKRTFIRGKTRWDLDVTR